jgi:hypothetical protein
VGDPIPGSEETDKSGFICPVCKKSLIVRNLPDKASIVDDMLQLQGIHFVGEVKIHCDFKHDFDENGDHIDEPHELSAVITMKFDRSGKCIGFQIVNVCAR